MTDDQRKMLEQTYNYYEVQFQNHGGLVMPIIVQLNYEDGSHEIVRIRLRFGEKTRSKLPKVS